MQIKNRIILFAYFIFMALVSLVFPAAGLRVIEDEKKCADERRKFAEQCGGGLRAGDRV